MARGAAGRPGPAGADAAAAAAAGGPLDLPELARAAAYAAIDEVGRAAIAGELREAAGRGGGSAGAALPAAAPGGPIDRAVRIAAGRAGLPDPRAGACPPEFDAAAAAVLTALLHYLLSAASVPSQRRVEVGGEEIDIVVPDAAGLPDAVAVCIAGDAGLPAAASRIAAASAALRLPRGRVWAAGWSRSSAHSGPAAALHAPSPGPARAYLASDGSFSSLVPDLAAFAALPAGEGGGSGGSRRGRRLGLSGFADGERRANKN